MRVSYQTLLLGAATLASAWTPPEDDCSNPNFADSKESGATWDLKDGNTYFCDTRIKEGLSICGIRAWTYKYHHAGIQFMYSNGEWGPLHGRRMEDGEKDNWTPKPNEITWDCAEPITDYHKFSNWEGFSDIEGKSDAVGGIRITAGGKEFKATSDVGSFGGEFVEIGSGYIAAARGRAGSYLDTLELKFFKSKVKQAKIIDLKFNKDLDAVNKQKDGIQTFDIDDVWYVNPDEKGNRTYQFTNSIPKDITKTISHGTDHTFGVKVGVTASGEAGVPLLAKGKWEVSTEVNYQMVKKTEESLADKKGTILQYGLTGSLGPKSATYCKAWSFTGTYEDDYTAVVRITFNDNNYIDVSQGGHYQSIGWTSAVAICDDKPIEEAPTDATIPSGIEGTERKVRAITFNA